MKRLIRNILMTLMALPAIGLSSCVWEAYPEEASAPAEEEGKVWLHVNVSSLNASDLYGDNNRDLIYSLRVIMLNDKGEVEFNRYERLASPQSKYDFEVLAEAGEKRFYFIANADNIDIYEPGNDSPLKEGEFFGRYPIGSDGFEEAVKELYYKNNYFDNTSYPLPYTSKYVVKAEKGKQNFKFWLVKAATKYTVHFENSRSESVVLHDLYIRQLIDRMYLMPHVSQETISGKYWIDWLHEVSDASHESGSNQGDVGFNDNWGWLTGYQVPEGEAFDLYLVQDEEITIPGLQTGTYEDPKPGTADLGPFYSVEGRNLREDGGGIQQYTLHLRLTDNKDNKEVEDYRILPNLNALFRNTHLIINITFDESYMHVYGQIQGWDTHDAFGKVTEEK